MSTSSTYIPRQLSWVDRDGKSQSVGEADLLTRFNGPLVVLGPPGVGKTELLKSLMGHKQDPVRAKALLRMPTLQCRLWDNRLFIDGLDEVAAAEEGEPLHKVLKKLAKFGRPNFVISCRSFEWDSVIQGTEILDDYGVRPVELTVNPFDRTDAKALLSTDLGPEKAEEVLDQLDNLGLDELHTNPLMLGFISTIARENQEFPQNKGELYEKAVVNLYFEKNRAHPQHLKLSKISKEQALSAAGAAMAAMLISGRDALSRTLNDLDTNVLAISELSEFAEINCLETVLGTNLFRPFDCAGSSAVPFHRTIAEFLGAKWLAERVADSKNPSRTVGRILGLISAEGGVPASLRAMHAWLAYFSPTNFAPRVIETDPFGVVRYGDTAKFSLARLRQLLAALKRLSKDDPAFREGHWDKQPVVGLARRELLNEFREVLTSAETSWALRSLLIESLQGAELAYVLEDDLWKILSDPDNTYRERRECSEVLIQLAPNREDWSLRISGLVSQTDDDSSTLALDIMGRLGFERFDSKLIAQAVVSETGILIDPINEERRSVSGTLHRLYRTISVEKAPEVLDELVTLIAPFRFEDKDRWQHRDRWDARHRIANFTNELLQLLIAANSVALTADSILRWLRSLGSDSGYQRDAKDKVAKFFEENHEMRYSIQHLALSRIKDEREFFWESYKLGKLSPGLQLRSTDYARFLDEVSRRKDPREKELWQSLVTHFWGDKGLPKEVIEIALPFAELDEELVAFLNSMKRKRPLPEWERKERRNVAARRRAREKKNAEARAKYRENLDAVRAGELSWIHNPAQAYLGMYHDLDRKSLPVERLVEWLGEDLLEPILVGLEAVLRRSDIPSAKEVAENYANSKRYHFIYPMIAAAAQRINNDVELSDLSDDLLMAIAIGAENEHIGEVSEIQGFEGFQGKLFSALKDRGADIYEAFLRQRFEPYLVSKRDHISGLYSFTRTFEEYPLSAKLAWGWLTQYPELPHEVQRELVGCLINAPEELRSRYWPMLTEKAKSILQDVEKPSALWELWISVLFTVNFPNAVGFLPQVSKANRELIWTFTAWFYDRYGDERGRITPDLEQAKWLVETFRSVWPFSRRPNGVTSGNHNPWDATARITWALGKIASDTSVDASIALSDLRESLQDGYSLDIQADIARQKRARLEDSFRTPTMDELKSAINDKQPMTPADVQAIVLAEIEDLQRRVEGDKYNVIGNFYDDQGRPRTENECRDQLFIALGKNLPWGIQTEPEVAMPQGKRSDTAFVYGHITVPLEAKGQWHKDVWTAATSQLDKYYTVDNRAGSKGIYVVFWFGAKAPAGKRLRLPPKPLTRPSSPDDMKAKLEGLLPEHRKGDISVFVLDLERPDTAQ